MLIDNCHIKKNHTIKVAILLPTYNAGKYLELTLESLCNQTYSNIDIVILDDGSADKTLKIVKGYQKQFTHIYLYENPKNLGVIPTRNKLFSMSEATFFALMDADDICHPERIEKQVDYLVSHPHVSAVGSWYAFLGERKGIVKVPCEHSDIKAALFFDNVLCNPSVMVRREFMQENRLQCDVAYAGAADYLLWVKASQKGILANLPEALFQYRVHPNQESTVNRDRQQRVHLRIVREQLASLGINEQPIECLRAIIWPSEPLQLELLKVGFWVKNITGLLESADNPIKNKLIFFIDIRYRSLCSHQGKKGLIIYLRTLGLYRLMQGRKKGFSFIISCCR